MRIEQPHSIGQQEAIRRIDGFLENLVQNPPGGITVRDASKQWTGSRMDFSFTAARGVFGTTISGVMEVLDDKIIVDSQLPLLVKNFIGEARIQQVISHELGDMLRP